MKFTAATGTVEGWREHSKAHIAQLVERILGKDEVFGPIPNAGSTSWGKAWMAGTTGYSMPFFRKDLGIFTNIT